MNYLAISGATAAGALLFHRLASKKIDKKFNKVPNKDSIQSYKKTVVKSALNGAIAGGISGLIYEHLGGKGKYLNRFGKGAAIGSLLATAYGSAFHDLVRYSVGKFYEQNPKQYHKWLKEEKKRKSG